MKELKNRIVKNYIVDALDLFMKDNNLEFDEKFYLIDWRKKEKVGEAYISPFRMFVIVGDGIRNDKLIDLLSGKWIPEKIK